MIATLAILAMAQGPDTLSELAASLKVAAPGVKFSVALHLRHAPGWHTYFINPGGAGFPATVKWTLPKGVVVGPIQWPVPHREEWQGETTYLYDGDLYMPMLVSVPSDWTVGKKLTLTAKATWLTCSESCVRQSADLKIEIPVAQKSAANPSYEKAVAASGWIYPQPVGAALTATAAGRAVWLDPSGLREADASFDFFSTDQDNFGAAAPTVSKGGLLIPLGADAKQAPAALRGILAVMKDGKPVRAWTLDVPVKR